MGRKRIMTSKKTGKKISPVSINIIDGNAVHGLCEEYAIQEGRNKVALNFTALKQVLTKIRLEEDMCVATNNFILLATDSTSESQGRFQTAGFTVDAVDFRSVFPSLAPGRSREKNAQAPEISLAARLSYIVGLQARHQTVELMVVTHDFALAGALMDLARRSDDSRIAVVFFEHLMDHRWRTVKFPLRLSGRDLVERVNLEKYAEVLFGFQLMSNSRDVVAESLAFQKL